MRKIVMLLIALTGVHTWAQDQCTTPKADDRLVTGIARKDLLKSEAFHNSLIRQIGDEYWGAFQIKLKKMGETYSTVSKNNSNLLEFRTDGGKSTCPGNNSNST